MIHLYFEFRVTLEFQYSRCKITHALLAFMFSFQALTKTFDNNWSCGFSAELQNAFYCLSYCVRLAKAQAISLRRSRKLLYLAKSFILCYSLQREKLCVNTF